MTASFDTSGRLVRSRGARRLAAGGGALAAAGALASCSAFASAEADPDDADFFDADSVHSIAVSYDEDEYDAMMGTFTSTGEKDWIAATVTIDGEEYQDVGLRLKGNSSLRGLGGGGEDAAGGGEQGGGPGGGADGASADDPAGLPWLIRLDKYVDGQEHDGRADYVVRSNTSETSLNEAVALHVLELADVTAEQAAYARFSVNGSDEQLRLVLDLPDDALWNEAVYPDGGITYKADSEGDWSYRGDEASAYEEVFEAKDDSTGGTDDETYAPLAAFLDFVNNSSDTEFADGLGDRLDVDAFARYLAAQELVANSDDIDGPGNNAYLHYDPTSGLMEVVAWDQNLSYGGMGGGFGGGAGGGRAPDGGEAPQDGPRPDVEELPEGELPEGMEPPAGGGFPGADGGQDAAGGRGGFGGQDNPLVTRFLDDDGFAAAYEAALADLTASVYESGDAQDHLDELSAMLSEEASDLVDADTVASEADAIAARLTGDDLTGEQADDQEARGQESAQPEASDEQTAGS
ncbi:CotH kinase family protein [Isoptericola sp. BMS4]|uniref:CotH kinase family protein n=1 Tax=Isoptericola sp. BMS4 TaxID=2527875 RepID=UPI00196B8FED|nr:CotH kinase family protein [Isoptericola sp. BMS4]